MKPTPFTQTPEWAAIHQHFNKADPVWIEHESVFCLFGFYPVEKTLISFSGPMASEATTEKDLIYFLKKTQTFAKTNKVKHIRFTSLFPLRSWPETWEPTFLQLGFKHQPWRTFMVDLTQQESQLWKNLAHAARKSINKANALPIHIKQCDSFDSYHEHFLLPYLQTTQRPYRNQAFYEETWALDTLDTYRYWVAVDTQSKPLAFLGTYRHDGVATEIMSAMTPSAFKEKIPAQDLLHWEILKHHQSLGDLYFDLAGFNPSPQTEKEKNIQRFKAKWGGTVYDTSSYHLDCRSWPLRQLSGLKHWIKNHV